MAFVAARCPSCGEEIEINPTQDSFFCIHCGKKAITQAALIYADIQSNNFSPANSILESAPPVTTNEEEKKAIRRVFLFLEDRDWDKAYAYCERILDYNPENSDAYLAEFLLESKLSGLEQIRTYPRVLENHPKFQKALRFADSEQKRKLEELVQQHDAYQEELKANARREDEERRKLQAEAEADKHNLYNSAIKLLQTQETEAVRQAYDSFLTLHGWQDADEYLEQCRKFLNIKYQIAMSMAGSVSKVTLRAALEIFDALGEWKDATAQASKLRNEL